MANDSNRNNTLNKLRQQLEQWEREGYDVSELKSKWAVESRSFASDITEKLPSPPLDTSEDTIEELPPLPPPYTSNERRELDDILNKSNYTPEKLIEFFEKDHRLELLSSSGVWEKYTIKQHTLMVIRQFDKYFSDTQLPSEMSHNFFRVILALHDLSKPEAIAMGGKHLKFEYAEKKMKSILSKLHYTTQEISMAAALVSEDPIGPYLAKRMSIKTSAGIIYMMARQAMLKVDALFSLICIFYMVDAGSYTQDAGGKKSLDYLFIFNTKRKDMNFSKDYEKMMGDLWNYVKGLDSK